MHPFLNVKTRSACNRVNDDMKVIVVVGGGGGKHGRRGPVLCNGSNTNDQ